jgi:hypothetical protein
VRLSECIYPSTLPAVQIPVLMVANTASVDEHGMLNVQVGGWEHTSPLAAPFTLSCSIAGIAVLDESEWGTSQLLDLTVGDLAETNPRFTASVVISGIREAPVPGVPMRMSFAVPFTFPVLGSTVVRVRALHQGTELASWTFQIRTAINDAKPAE